MTREIAPPPGKLAVTVTHLERMSQPTPTPMDPPNDKLVVMQAERPTLSFYLFLYRSVGERWLWADRLRMSDEALKARIHAPRTTFYVLYDAGVPAGFADIYSLDDTTKEIVSFGLMPEFIGRRLGPYFLDQVIRRAWTAQTRRLQLETCTLDHPRALQTYQQAGFVAQRRETVFRDDPRLLGCIPRDAAPMIPMAAPIPEPSVSPER